MIVKEKKRGEICTPTGAGPGWGAGLGGLSRRCRSGSRLEFASEQGQQVSLLTTRGENGCRPERFVYVRKLVGRGGGRAPERRGRRLLWTLGAGATQAWQEWRPGAEGPPERAPRVDVGARNSWPWRWSRQSVLEPARPRAREELDSGVWKTSRNSADLTCARADPANKELPPSPPTTRRWRGREPGV